MNQSDAKKHSDTKSDQHKAQHGKTQGVTTNPEDVGAGGGSAPAGHGNQDSRTWGAHDNQKNAAHETQQEARSKKADVGIADEQVGHAGHKPEATKGAARKH